MTLVWMQLTCPSPTAGQWSSASPVPAAYQPRWASFSARPAASPSLSTSPAGQTHLTAGRDRSARLSTADDSVLPASAEDCSLLHAQKMHKFTYLFHACFHCHSFQPVNYRVQSHSLIAGSICKKKQLDDVIAIVFIARTSRRPRAHLSGIFMS